MTCEASCNEMGCTLVVNASLCIVLVALFLLLLSGFASSSDMFGELGFPSVGIVN